MPPKLSEAEIEARILQGQGESGELQHNLFAMVTSRLPKWRQKEFQSANFEIADPSSELYLEQADPDEETMELLQHKALCVEVYGSEYLQGVASTAKDRKKKLISQLVGAKRKGEGSLAYKRSVCNEENYQVFQAAGLERDDAECCVFALSFYTGAGSNSTSRGASLAVRTGNMIVESDEAEVEKYLEKYSHVVYFLSKALQILPFYWGPAVRHITLSAEVAAAVYEPGNVVTWMQYSSSKKGLESASSFEERNCKFVIWSIKGRHIAKFSNFGESEDEVLFTPFTRMLVLRREKDASGNWTIYLREVELGLTKGLPLLWVDDRILGEDFEMKPMMEAAMAITGRDIKYILKPSTELALAFLKSWFGQQVKTNPNFRVVQISPGHGDEDCGRERRHRRACQ
eukprot:COSAG01_NODE_5414_length_4277_cov_7.150551_4_plen_401_part_00